MVADGEFRQDLMYRINTFIVDLPVLRDRVLDIPELAFHLLKRTRSEIQTVEQAFEDSALELLQSHHWPGNIRELANVIEHASILSDSLPISAADLPTHLGQPSTLLLPVRNVGKSLREIEMETIYATLDSLNGNKTAAAEQLGISLKTLYNKLNSDTQRRAA
jgi:two-component system NtrC family response regulator